MEDPLLRFRGLHELAIHSSGLLGQTSPEGKGAVAKELTPALGVPQR